MFKVFSVITTDNERLNILSPNIELIKELIDVKEYKILDVKTTHSVDKILVRSKSKRHISLNNIDKQRFFPIDVYVNECIPKRKRIKNEDTLRVVEKNTINRVKFNSNPLIRESNNLRSEEEALVLADSINYYLEKLELDLISNETKMKKEEFFRLSSLGDALVSFDVKQKLFYSEDCRFVTSNYNMKHALIKIGFNELVNSGEHLVGSLYEMLYYISYIQNNYQVKNLLLETLIKGKQRGINTKLIFQIEKDN